MFHSRFQCARFFLCLGVLVFIAAPGLSAEMPKRKAGLWEIHTRMEGVPSMGAIQQCIDEKTDSLMQQQVAKGKTDCSVMDVKRANGKVSIHSVCKAEGVTITSDADFEGSFDSAYKGTIKSQYDPPFNGMADMTIQSEARWVGPCKPGQKPGDVIMPQVDMTKSQKALEEMMKNPKVKEMMEGQQKQ